MLSLEAVSLHISRGEKDLFNVLKVFQAIAFVFSDFKCIDRYTGRRNITVIMLKTRVKHQSFMKMYLRNVSTHVSLHGHPG